jgi:aminodeoxyfutalosine synthase
MAGSEEQNPAMTTEQLVSLIKQVNRNPVERDTLYNVVKDYSTTAVPEETGFSNN